jgi:hypothetical protein
MAKFNCEVLQCAEEKGNCKTAAIFGVNEAKFDCCKSTWQRSASVRCHERNSLDWRKDNFQKIYNAVFTFFKEREEWKKLLYYFYRT